MCYLLFQLHLLLQPTEEAVALGEFCTGDMYELLVRTHICGQFTTVSATGSLSSDFPVSIMVAHTVCSVGLVPKPCYKYRTTYDVGISSGPCSAYLDVRG